MTILSLYRMHRNPGTCGPGMPLAVGSSFCERDEVMVTRLVHLLDLNRPRNEEEFQDIPPANPVAAGAVTRRSAA
jgi:hypothetical protein